MRFRALNQQQYEENPYPRWVRIPRLEQPSTIAGYLRKRFPLADFKHEGGNEIADILSVGCGTGQLALEIAQGIRSRTLAVDLSIASLGYAKRKAQELGLTRDRIRASGLAGAGRHRPHIRRRGMFRRAASFGRSFCRMARACCRCLRPGGFMMLGLYSETARQGIVKAQTVHRAGRLWHIRRWHPALPPGFAEFGCVPGSRRGGFR